MMLSILEKTARALIRKYKPTVICVIGSVGKTSVKDAISSTLSTSFDVRKTPKNINNEFGVVVSVIGGFKFKEGFWALLDILFFGLYQLLIKNYFPEILVIEVGAGKIGEIENVSKWLKPNFLVITNLPDKPSHLGVFKSKENIIREKKFLVDVMDSDGVVFLDESEDNMQFFVKDFFGKIIKYKSKELIKSSNYSVIYEERENSIYPVGINFFIDVGGKNKKVKFSNFIGRHNIKAILISKLIAEKLGCKSENILTGISNYIPEAGRLKILQGILKKVTIIDDSYNSSPIAVENSLYNLISLKTNLGQRKIAVLGDMLNLGNESESIHMNTAIDNISKVDVLITVGDISKSWQKFNKNKLKLNRHFKNSINSAEYIKSIWRSGDIILFKGGHFIRLEKAVKLLTKSSEKDLVRQEKYWQKPEFELYQIEDDKA